MSPGTTPKLPATAVKAEASGRLIRLGTPRSLIPALMTLRAVQTGPWNAFALATWMSGVHGNTARRGLKIVHFNSKYESAFIRGLLGEVGGVSLQKDRDDFCWRVIRVIAVREFG